LKWRTPFYCSAEAMKDFISNRINHKHFIFAYINHTLVVHFQLPIRLDSRHGQQMQQLFDYLFAKWFTPVFSLKDFTE